MKVPQGYRVHPYGGGLVTGDVSSVDGTVYINKNSVVSHAVLRDNVSVFNSKIGGDVKATGNTRFINSHVDYGEFHDAVVEGAVIVHGDTNDTRLRPTQ